VMVNLMHDSFVSLWGLFASAFISSTLAPGGSEVVLGYLVANSQISLLWLLIVATVGNTLGAMTTWWLGVMAAKKFPLDSHLSGKKLKAMRIIKERGLWVLFFSWLPLIGDAFCFAGGWLKLPLMPACLIISSGKLSRYAVIAWMVTSI
jgi:membrane protein YqaA with SNARE-associated domain